MDFTTVSKELHKQVIRNFPRRKVISLYTYEILAIDLMDLQEWEKHNNGYKYIFSIIDVFSKFGWLIPLRDKQAKTIVEALKNTINEIDIKPSKIWCDRGSEFFNKQMDDFLKRNKIIRYSTYGEHKCVVVERFNRTIKNWLWKYFSAKQTRNWVDTLDDLAKYYNKQKHRTIGMKPEDAIKPENSETVFQNSYGKYYSDLLSDETVQEPKFSVGDLVRISRVKQTFEHGYLDNWSLAVYKVSKVLKTTPITYNLTEYDNTPLEGSFYEQELQKTKEPEFYMVEKILKERKKKGKKQYYVKWMGWENKYNSWLDEQELKDIQGND